MLRLSVCLLALAAALGFLQSGDDAHADELLHVASSINYDVNVGDTSVAVTWDVTVTNNDPSTGFAGGTVSFYGGLSLPILAGGSEVSARSGGTTLAVSQAASDDLLDRVEIDFNRNLFYGDTYDFTLTYVIPETRTQTVLVTPFYVYVPLITLGDEATVTVTTPSDPAWQVSYDGQECPKDEVSGTLRCSESETVYLAGVLEVHQPAATSTIDFEAPLAEGSVAVDLTYFQGEDAAAAHQLEVIRATLPLIADVYGFAYPGPPKFSVSHGGRQRVFGYEGLADCDGTGCQIVISPAATDVTLVHELAHLWSGVYQARWLSEGWAEWAAREVARRTPEGFLTSDRGDGPQTTLELQLDDWGDPQSVIGASEEYVAITQAGYDLSLRFIETLAEEAGVGKLQEVNRELAETGLPAESRRYMDLLEDAAGINPDALFELWVFPDSYDTLLLDRREARDRYNEVAGRLVNEGLSEEPLAKIREMILGWRFGEALAALDVVEDDVGTYFELTDELEGLRLDADALGLLVPEDIAATIGRWEFDAADGMLEAARAALGAYTLALEKVDEPRNLWQRFGLIGDDPGGELDGAREAFESGAFERAEERAHSAVEMVDEASAAAARRLLIVVGVFAAFGIALAVAYWVALVRQRRLADP